MMKPVLLIIAQQGYQDVELDGTRKGLKDAGFLIVLASTEAGPCHGKYDGNETADIAMKDVKISDYDRIAFIGGPGADALKDNEDALRIAREAVASNMILGAICIAPTILAAAGVIDGKRVTGWDDGQGTQITFLEDHGATFVNEPVVTDGRIVTGDGPGAAEEFGRKLASL